MRTAAASRVKSVLKKFGSDLFLVAVVLLTAFTLGFLVCLTAWFLSRAGNQFGMEVRLFWRTFDADGVYVIGKCLGLLVGVTP